MGGGAGAAPRRYPAAPAESFSGALVGQRPYQKHAQLCARFDISAMCGLSAIARSRNMHDLIIIGGGAAALSAAVYALGKQLDVMVIYEDLGGKAGARQHLRGQAGEEYLA